MTTAQRRRRAARSNGTGPAIFALAACCGLATVAEGAFVSPTLWSRGQAGTTYQEWAGFSSPSGPNAASVGLYNPNGTPVLVDPAGTSVLTSGGNLYGFASALSIDVSVPDYAQAGRVTTVVLQVRTLGTEIDPASMQIDGLSPVDSVELSREAMGGFGGSQVEMWYRFELPASSAAFTVAFQATGPHMSLNGVAVDSITAPDYIPEPEPVPEPMTALLCLGGLAMLRTRRRGTGS